MELLLAFASIVLLVAASITVKREYLPSIALGLYAILPIGYSSAPQVLTILTPSCLVMAIWVLGGLLEKNHRAAHARSQKNLLAQVGMISTVLFTMWMVLKTIDSVSLQRSLAWGGAFMLLALCPLLTPMDRATSSKLKTTWMVLGALLSVYGLFEYAFEENLLYSRLYQTAPFPIAQYWSSYRITTSLGHPLWNSLFFAVSAAIAVGQFAETGRSRWLALGVLSGVGVFLTVSRGGIVAMTLAVLAIAVAALAKAANGRGDDGRSSSVEVVRKGGGAPRALVILALCLVCVALVSQSSIFQQRSSSSNGVASSAARFELIPLALEISEEDGYLGSGTGTSNYTVLDAGQGVVVENSYLQLLVSLGIPGLAFLLIVLIAAILAAFRAGSYAVGGGLLAYSVSIAGFNWLEANRPGLLILGLLLALVWSDSLLANRRREEVEISPPTSPRIRRDVYW